MYEVNGAEDGIINIISHSLYFYILFVFCFLFFVVTAEKDRSMSKWKIGAGCHGDTARAMTRDRHFCVMHFEYVTLGITSERI